VKIEDKLQQLLEYSFENEVVEFKEAKDNFDFNKLGSPIKEVLSQVEWKR